MLEIEVPRGDTLLLIVANESLCLVALFGSCQHLLQLCNLLVLHTKMRAVLGGGFTGGAVLGGKALPLGFAPSLGSGSLWCAEWFLWQWDVAATIFD